MQPQREVKRRKGGHVAERGEEAIRSFTGMQVQRHVALAQLRDKVEAAGMIEPDQLQRDIGWRQGCDREMVEHRGDISQAGMAIEAEGGGNLCKGRPHINARHMHGPDIHAHVDAAARGFSGFGGWAGSSSLRRGMASRAMDRLLMTARRVSRRRGDQSSWRSSIDSHAPL